MNTTGLRFGALNGPIAHLCVDMQRIFAEKTEWYVPELSFILPVVEQIVTYRPMATIFTKFITAENGDKQPRRWRAYYHRET